MCKLQFGTKNIPIPYLINSIHVYVFQSYRDHYSSELFEKVALYVWPNRKDDGIHSYHSYLGTLEKP